MQDIQSKIQDIQNNQKRKRLNEFEMSSQEIYDSLCELASDWGRIDNREYIDKLKNISNEQVNNNDPIAMNNLGFIFLKDYQYSFAERLLLESAKLGNSTAMCNLGCMYLLSRYSDFEKQNISVAKYWFDQAVSVDDKNKNLIFVKNSMHYLRSIYEKQGDYKKAEECYLKAVELGSYESREGLCRVYTALACKWKEVNKGY
jgi:TPR repeat protein